MSEDKKSSTSVVFVRRRDAKAVKTHLENESLLDRRFRMTPFECIDVRHDDDDDAAAGGTVDAHTTIDYAFLMKSFTASHNDDGGGGMMGGLVSPLPDEDAKIRDCIAVPVTEDCVERLQQHHDSLTRNCNEDADNSLSQLREKSDDDRLASWLDSNCSILEVIVGYGKYSCPFSTSILGNNRVNRHRTNNTAASNRVKKEKNLKLCSSNTTAESTSFETDNTSQITNNSPCSNIKRKCDTAPPLTNVQYTLIETLTTWMLIDENKNTANNDQNTATPKCASKDAAVVLVESLVRSLSNQTCPKKLEVIGDDRTLVVPRWSLFIEPQQSCSHDTVSKGSERGSSEFCEVLVRVIREHIRMSGDAEPIEKGTQQPLSETSIDNMDVHSTIIQNIQSQLWENLAKSHNSPRVVRRGDIDPESGVRESGHRILWPMLPEEESISAEGDCNLGSIPTTTGPNSPGWITVTEHKIRQSFDLTRVMFSRGNVTEKKRFGMACVQPGEDVLDMYAGIGYYTLPALIHGKARHVTACEWNTHALYALRHNLKANGVEDKVTVLEGDCRLQLKQLIENDRVGGDSTNTQFDRISLGLLPSSEGGWAIAVSCLRKSTGGWLHVHGNVPTVERIKWAHWLCCSLVNIAADKRDGKDGHSNDDWIAVCTHVEKVKSFAPKVDHVVADVFLGPSNSPKVPRQSKGDEKSCFETGVFDQTGAFLPTPLNTSPPSCALSDDGILHQYWLRGSS